MGMSHCSVVLASPCSIKSAILETPAIQYKLQCTLYSPSLDHCVLSYCTMVTVLMAVPSNT